MDHSCAADRAATLEASMARFRTPGDSVQETSGDTSASNPMVGEAPSSTGNPHQPSGKTRRPSTTKGSARKRKGKTAK
jgi:hypothetical protein